MLHVLPESRRRRRRASGVLATSVVAHAAVVGAVLAGTARATPAPAAPARELVYVATPRATPRAPTPPAPRASVPRSSPRASSAGAAAPAPPTVDPIVAPVLVLDLLPPAGRALRPLDEDAFARGLRGASGGPAGPGAGGAGAGPAVYPDALVDRAVVPLGGAAPRYPEALRAAGVEGTVVAEFVVDTAGRVEPASVTLADGAHPPFAQAVRQALRAMRFRPAEVDGRRVRQRVRQPFAFTLAR